MRLALDQTELDLLADDLAGRVADRLARRLPTEEMTEGHLRPDAAARYIGASGPKRIYDLKSIGDLDPDGFDGRIPLFTRDTLDAYVRAVPTLQRA